MNSKSPDKDDTFSDGMPPGESDKPVSLSNLARFSLLLPGVGLLCLIVPFYPVALVGIYLLPFASVAGVILGLAALVQIARRPKELHGLPRACTGIFLGTLGILIMLPGFIQLRNKSYNAVATSAGYNAKIAQELHFQQFTESEQGRYADNLAALLKMDANLTDDVYVTFLFGECDASGYTFTTTHAKGNQFFVHNERGTRTGINLPK